MKKTLVERNIYAVGKRFHIMISRRPVERGGKSTTFYASRDTIEQSRAVRDAYEAEHPPRPKFVIKHRTEEERRIAHRESHRRSVNKRRAAGLCLHCESPGYERMVRGSIVRSRCCERCLKTSALEWRIRREEKRQAGECRRCRANADAGFTTCEPCREAYKQKRRKRKSA